MIEGALTDLPAANAKKEANDVALLLLRKLLEVLKGTHFACADLASQSLVASRKLWKLKVRGCFMQRTTQSCREETFLTYRLRIPVVSTGRGNPPRSRESRDEISETFGGCGKRKP